MSNREGRYDRGWAQLQHQSDDIACITPFAPKSKFNQYKRGFIGRVLRTAWLYMTTKYRLSTAWAAAGV
jgi:hypothetical protein